MNLNTLLSASRLSFRGIFKAVAAALAAVALALPASGQKETSNLKPLEPGWALATVSTAHMRGKAAHASELVSQVIMGTPVKLLEKSGEWYLVESPEGYRGYVSSSSLNRRDGAGMAAWASAPRVVVTSLDQTYALAEPDASSPRNRVTDLVNGSILEIDPEAGEVDGWLGVKLPDGRQGWVDAADVEDFDAWCAKPFDAEALLDYAYAMEGAPYLWGGTSNKALDCSGLSKTAYFTQGIILRRDASQQARTGGRVEADQWATLRPADLVYFGNPETGKVTHVGIYNRDGEIIHSSGKVRRNNLAPGRPDTLKGYTLLWCTTMADYTGTDGITRVADHPWYTSADYYRGSQEAMP